MAQRYEQIQDKYADFIAQQKMFFVATATATGHINLSPKGMDCLRVLGPNRLIWLNVTGSGNETAAHLQQQDRITLMWCAMQGDPLILRVYGNAKVIHPRDSQWNELFRLVPNLPGARQIIDVDVTLVQSSCGMAVPFYAYEGEREQLNQWASKKGTEGIAQYWHDKNRQSLDGEETGILKSE